MGEKEAAGLRSALKMFPAPLNLPPSSQGLLGCLISPSFPCFSCSLFSSSFLSRFGLHRAGFNAQSKFYSLKLLVGLDVATCDRLGFPLLEALHGPGNSYLIHIMK